MPQDRYQYFRIEARELIEGMTQSLLALERPGSAQGHVQPIMRQAHTLKGAAFVVGQGAIADAAHALEDLLATLDTGAARAPAELVAPGLQLLDRMSEGLARLGPVVAEAPGARAPEQADGAIETVRVDLAAMDRLLEDLAEAASRLDGLQRQGAEWRALERLASALAAERSAEPGPAHAMALALASGLSAARRGLLTGLEQASLELASARDRAHTLRLVPASLVFSQLERGVREAALARGVQVAFEGSGGDTRLDGPVLLQLRDALLHVTRNAVAHGIEPARQRLAEGKRAEGRVRVHVERQGGRVAFRCEDDGAGIDPEALRQAAVRLGHVRAAEAAATSDEDALMWVFRAGLTTDGRVSELSGRGVGLDAVEAIVRGLKGELALTSERGRGTTLTLTVPLSLSALPALLLEANGQVAALPLESVASTFHLPATAAVLQGGQAIAWHDGRALPFLALAEALAPGPGVARPRAFSAVLVRSEAGEAIVGVDRLMGIKEIVVRPLPALVGTLPLLSGASFDAEGAPQAVLDPAGLVAAARRGGLVPAPLAAPLPILVVDDSLTTRMLEQSILETAGYTVDLASSAEEGIELARARRFGLFVVDVEMPGMSGFDFTEATRRDARLAQTPVILVTSRDTAADRRRGLEAGASAYIVKGDFDQRQFLGLVRDMLR